MDAKRLLEKKRRRRRETAGGGEAKDETAAAAGIRTTRPSASAWRGAGGHSWQRRLPSPEGPPRDPGLHASRQSLHTLYTADYWRRLCPQLHVQDESLQTSSAPIEAPWDDVQEARERINAEGYTDIRAEDLNLSVRLEDLARAVVQLMQHGWQPSFITMYDEAWQLAHEVSQIMKLSTGNEINMDMLAWYIDPNKGDSGFSPHRDRQPDHSPGTFRADGSAKYTTIWIPFTDATQDNSCLYVIPRQHDPGYFAGDDDREDAPDPLSVALDCKQAFQHVRALPVTAGSALIFTHRIIHWGSKGRRGCKVPRISFSFGCASDDYEPPYFSRENLPFPDHKLRLGLACAQMIVYHERFQFSRAELSTFHNIFKKEAHRFTQLYQSTVKFELIGTVKDVEQREVQHPDEDGIVDGSDGGSSDGDMLDDVMDAMLEAEMRGVGEFEDDFIDSDEEVAGAQVQDQCHERAGTNGEHKSEQFVRKKRQKQHPSLHGGMTQAKKGHTS